MMGFVNYSRKRKIYLRKKFIRKPSLLVGERQQLKPCVFSKASRKIIGLTSSQHVRRFFLRISIEFSSNLELFKNDLMNIARTTLSSKILQGKKDYFARLCVDAVLKLHVIFNFIAFSRETTNVLCRVEQICKAFKSSNVWEII